MQFRHLVVALSLLPLVACVSPVREVEQSTPGTQRGAFFTTVDDIKTERMEAVKGESRVIVPYFRVAFYMTKDASEQALGTSSTGTASLHVNSELLGVEPSVMQAIVDAAYADFVAKLTAAGFEVLPQDQLNADADYQAIDTVENPSENKTLFGPKAFVVAPTGQPLVWQTGALAAFSGGSIAKIGPKLIQNHNAALIDVTYYVDYLNLSTSGGGFFSTRAEAQIGAGLSVTANSGLSFTSVRSVGCVGFCANTMGRVTLGQAVYSTEEFGELADVTSDVGLQTGLNVVSGLLTGSVRSRRDYEMKADPEAYQRIAIELLQRTNDGLVGELAAAR